MWVKALGEGGEGSWGKCLIGQDGARHFQLDEFEVLKLLVVVWDGMRCDDVS